MDIKTFFKKKKDEGNKAQARLEEVKEVISCCCSSRWEWEYYWPPHLQAQDGEEEESVASLLKLRGVQTSKHTLHMIIGWSAYCINNVITQKPHVFPQKNLVVS